eukprot:TRINITY_DN5562_c0_g1_i6.p1 TRINITY_DN5562_c0_g1~~TRINITY_DN5562_c0_g1_i6.p1  ORF type:complete len:359 (-),score=54.29 TRINITY_DN5562_c0_g1_i6:112-1188(-)
MTLKKQLSFDTRALHAKEFLHVLRMLLKWLEKTPDVGPVFVKAVIDKFVSQATRNFTESVMSVLTFPVNENVFQNHTGYCNRTAQLNYTFMASNLPYSILVETGQEKLMTNIKTHLESYDRSNHESWNLICRESLRTIGKELGKQFIFSSDYEIRVDKAKEQFHANCSMPRDKKEILWGEFVKDLRSNPAHNQLMELANMKIFLIFLFFSHFLLRPQLPHFLPGPLSLAMTVVSLASGWGSAALFLLLELNSFQIPLPVVDRLRPHLVAGGLALQYPIYRLWSFVDFVYRRSCEFCEIVVGSGNDGGKEGCSDLVTVSTLIFSFSFSWLFCRWIAGRVFHHLRSRHKCDCGDGKKKSD